MNRLQYETSPYLLQHANNPVDWYAWKPEAFAKAKEEDKPILVSIGYSTCHWCHVMERESFEQEAIAKFMNEHFINIKVDREERPDVDQIYMEACQAITGGGGWPLNCFLTPDARPFLAGTYYPPKPAYNRPSWPQLLQHVANIFENKRDQVEDQANRLLEAIGRSERIFLKDQPEGEKSDFLQVETLDQIFRRMEDRFDTEYGGSGGAPKFPGTMTLQYLLHYGVQQDVPTAIEHVRFSLRKMIQGGIYDQIGGGFARYATDRAWLIPHFEKMLYDNALLVELLSDAYQITKEPLFREAIEETLVWVEREMTHPDGGFYAALDADSEGVEGKFYVWKEQEIEDILPDEYLLWKDFLGVRPDGNWEGTNILWRPESLEDFIESRQMDSAAAKKAYAEVKELLLQKRAERIRPGLDDKILLGWNALMVSGLAKAGFALNRPDYRERAQQTLDFLLETFQREKGSLELWHTYKVEGQYPAFLDDYAWLIKALLDVYEVSFETKYLDLAEQYTEMVLQNFLDPDSKLFYFTGKEQKDLPMRRKELYDNAVPAGNSTMVLNFQRLGSFLDKNTYREHALAMLQAVQEAVRKYPGSFARWSLGLFNQIIPGNEIAIVGQNAEEKVWDLSNIFLPNRVLMISEEAQAEYPLLADKPAKEDALVYWCQQYACRQPVSSIEELKQLIVAKPSLN
ncbi:MAG: thioredoxin domain-containing protein [Bacteroidota bacterium]